LAALDDAAFRKMFAGSAIKRTGRDRFVRNVLIAIGNAAPAEPELIATARCSLDDASPLVRAAAVWALTRLAPEQSADERAGRLPREQDPLVRAEWERAPLHSADGFAD
jgi:epoxyqueuosine reductase